MERLPNLRLSIDRATSELQRSRLSRLADRPYCAPAEFDYPSNLAIETHTPIHLDAPHRVVGCPSEPRQPVGQHPIGIRIGREWTHSTADPLNCWPFWLHRISRPALFLFVGAPPLEYDGTKQELLQAMKFQDYEMAGAGVIIVQVRDAVGSDVFVNQHRIDFRTSSACCRMTRGSSTSMPASPFLRRLRCFGPRLNFYRTLPNPRCFRRKPSRTAEGHHLRPTYRRTILARSA
jgi:hypothetical protein